MAVARSRFKAASLKLDSLWEVHADLANCVRRDVTSQPAAMTPACSPQSLQHQPAGSRLRSASLASGDADPDTAVFQMGEGLCLDNATKSSLKAMLADLVEEQMRFATQLGHDPLAIITEEHIDYCLRGLLQDYAEAYDIIYGANTIHPDVAAERCADLRAHAKQACSDVMTLLLRSGPVGDRSPQDYADRFARAHVALTRWFFAVGHFQQKGHHGEIDKFLDGLQELLSEVSTEMTSDDPSACHHELAEHDKGLIGLAATLGSALDANQDGGRVDSVCTRLDSVAGLFLRAVAPGNLPDSRRAKSLTQTMSETVKAKGTPCNDPCLVRAITRQLTLEVVMEHLEKQRCDKVKAAATKSPSVAPMTGPNGVQSPSLGAIQPIAKHEVNEVAKLDGSTARGGSG